jgi:hypothetical protein
MTLQKQSRLTTWLSLPTGWALTHRYKSRKWKNKTKHQKQKSITKHKSKTPPSEVTTPHHQQQTLQGFNIEEFDLQPFGDTRRPKTPQIFRVESHNINNLPDKGTTFKSQPFVARVCSPDVSATLAQEMGINWSKLKGRDKWHERLAGRRVHSNLAHNVREVDDTDRLQAGGTGLCIGAEHQGRCRTHGQDPTGLGRWAWTRIQGTSDYNTSLFSAYRPCASSNPGIGTVYSQHIRHLLSSTSEETRTQFLLDLVDAIHARQAAGDIIILGVDLNQDVRHRQIRHFFQELQMHNAILTRHVHLRVLLPLATKVTAVSRSTASGAVSGFTRLLPGSSNTVTPLHLTTD